MRAGGTNALLFAKILKLGLATEPLGPGDEGLLHLARSVEERTRRLLGRAVAIREVDAGSCNGCEIEITGLTSPVYDAARFGIHFVASPRHADLLLVTGPVTRNMELALRKTYEAMPAPRLVVAVGACGCSGGIFGSNYATLGGVDNVLPVDVYIPGCPPRPEALLYGLMRLQDIIMREAPSAYIFESDGTVRRQRSFDTDDEYQLSQQDSANELVTAAK